MSKVLLLNGSAHRHGCTATALDEMIKVFDTEGIETELIQVGAKPLRGCIGCGSCAAVCPQSCIIIDNVPRVIEQEHCLHCGNCLEACLVEAVKRR